MPTSGSCASMIPHHQQAIEMSDILLAKQGIDPRVTELANNIKAAESSGDPADAGLAQPMGQAHAGDDPGRHARACTRRHDRPAVRAGTERVGEATGTDASRLFLTQMIAHHEGAISVAQTEIEEGHYPLAVVMARSIASTQQQEIDTIKGILASL